MIRLMGYASHWSVAPGETIQFMVSCAGARQYVAELVRLKQPDAGPEATPFRPKPVQAPCNRSYPARYQRIPMGSLGVVPPHRALAIKGSFSLMAYVRPTTPGKGRQAIMGTWSERTRTGYGLEMDAAGCLRLLLGAVEQPTIISTSVPLSKRWYRVGMVYHQESATASLWQTPLPAHDLHCEQPLTVSGALRGLLATEELPLTFAAWSHGPASSASAWGDLDFACHFNGCIERPLLVRTAYSGAELARAHVSPEARDIVAAWDFSQGICSDEIIDAGPSKIHGILLNQPTRAVPGHNWTCSETDWTKNPAAYGAIHFHDDDLVDACWQPDFEFNVPQEMPSGIYAVRLTANDAEFWIPFVVRPPRGSSRSRVAFLLPTATYTAYQNHRSRFQSIFGENLYGRLNVLDSIDEQFIQTMEVGLSTYDRHSDGTGVAYASRHRPAFNIKPSGRLWNFNADLLLVDWLEKLGGDFDVVTDDDLHTEGVHLLKPYTVVITGSHPEYASLQMLDAVESYVREGGRLMYMGGNGFYWRIAYHPYRSGIIEIRRCEGVRSWDVDPGANHMSFTGERSGLWRKSGRPPQLLLGVGYVSQGFDRCSYYRRTSTSTNPRVRWAFDGIDGEILGDFGVIQGGAAGIEIDATNSHLGTPDHSLVLARSEKHSSLYELASEEVLLPHAGTDGRISSQIRAEITFFETPRGGAVFSTGSVAFAGSISWNNFDNNIFRLATNVLRRFQDPEPFVPPNEPQ